MNRTQGWVGLPMISKCLNYNVPSSTCTLLTADKQQRGPISYVTGDPYNITSTTLASGVDQVTVNPIPFATTKADAFGVPRPLQARRAAACFSKTLIDFAQRR